jgi:hypothetical protein
MENIEPARSGHGGVANRDINVSRSLSNVHSRLAPLIDNGAIADAFAQHETAANAWKFRYELFGRFGLLCAFLAMAAFAYQITLQSSYGEIKWLGIISAWLGALGILSQLVIVFTGAKDRWTTERYFAERIRCLKFQAFGLLSQSTGDDLAPIVDTWTRESLAALHQEELAGRAAVLNFSPSEVPLPITPVKIASDIDLINEASKLYNSLRLDIQSQHFAAQYRLATERSRWPDALSEFCFGGGAVLATVQLCIAVWPSFAGKLPSGTWPDWLSFITLLLFILSAVVAVYQRGGSFQADAERYLTYLREVRRIRTQHGDGSPASFFHRVKEMEEIALRELHDFARDTRQSSFIF